MPSFKQPPVTEVVLGVSFRPIEALKIPDFGALYSEFSARFPVVEEHPIYNPPIEPFGPAALAPNLSIEFGGTMVPRLWFLSQDREELVQIQRNWLAFNWRKLASQSEYHRWDAVRQEFVTAFQTLEGFVGNRGYGPITPVQCEVSYINQIELGTGANPRDLTRVLRLAGTPGGEFLPPVEQMTVQAQFVMPGEAGPIGRLHIAAQPALRREDGSPLLVLTLTARGVPRDLSMQGVMDFLDIGSEWVVEAFAAVTTQEMHDLWERES